MIPIGSPVRIVMENPFEIIEILNQCLEKRENVTNDKERFTGKVVKGMEVCCWAPIFKSLKNLWQIMRSSGR